jgi:hypothetical protein
MDVWRGPRSLNITDRHYRSQIITDQLHLKITTPNGIGSNKSIKNQVAAALLAKSSDTTQADIAHRPIRKSSDTTQPDIA